MIRRVVRAVIGLALALALAGPAAAATPDPNGFTLVGTGTLSPGFPLTGCAYQTSFTFDSTLAVDAGDVAGVYTAWFAGASAVCETTNSGAGFATVVITDWNGHSFPATTVQYQRTSTVLELTGTVDIAGRVLTILAAPCAFWWTSISPSVTYQMNCGLVAA